MNNSLNEIDQQLPASVRSGNSDAWLEVVSQFQGRLVAIARRSLKQSADAEDVVQETFLSLLKSPGIFRGESSLETWLFQLLRRRVADAHRRAGRAGRRWAGIGTILFRFTSSGLAVSTARRTSMIFQSRSMHQQMVLTNRCAAASWNQPWLSEQAECAAVGRVNDLWSVRSGFEQISLR